MYPMDFHWLVWNTWSQFLLLVSVAWTLFRMLEQRQHVSRSTWGFHVLLWLAMCMLTMLVLVSLAKLVSRSILSSIVSLFSRLFIASHHRSMMNTPITYVIIGVFFTWFGKKYTCTRFYFDIYSFRKLVCFLLGGAQVLKPFHNLRNCTSNLQANFSYNFFEHIWGW